MRDIGGIALAHKTLDAQSSAIAIARETHYVAEALGTENVPGDEALRLLGILDRLSERLPEGSPRRESARAVVHGIHNRRFADKAKPPVVDPV